jgi:hypothetical protein
VTAHSITSGNTRIVTETVCNADITHHLNVVPDKFINPVMAQVPLMTENHKYMAASR